MKKSERAVWIMAGAVLAGTAGEWFLGGKQDDHGLTRNVLVVMQLLIGLGMLVYPFARSSKHKAKKGSSPIRGSKLR